MLLKKFKKKIKRILSSIQLKYGGLKQCTETRQFRLNLLQAEIQDWFGFIKQITAHHVPLTNIQFIYLFNWILVSCL